MDNCVEKVVFRVFMIEDVPCVILAGGKSSRMGENKALLPFGAYPTLAEYQYARLKKIFKSLYISCKEPSLFGFDARFIVDDCTEFAPIFALKKAFCELDDERIFFIPVDTPFFDEESILFMLKHSGSVIAKSGEKTHNLVAIYAKEAKKEIEEMIKERDYRISHLAQRVGARYVEMDGDRLLNLNTKDEYERALNNTSV